MIFSLEWSLTLSARTSFLIVRDLGPQIGYSLTIQIICVTA